MVSYTDAKDDDWLDLTLESVRSEGAAVVTNVLDDEFIEETEEAIYNAWHKYQNDIPEEKRSHELGTVRLPMNYDPHFFKLFEVPELLDIVDNTVSETAILHVQNAFALPSLDPEETPEVGQNTFHQDFKRVLNEYMCSINCFFAISEFTEENGATRVVPGTHQNGNQRPGKGVDERFVNDETTVSQEYLRENAVTIECPAGSMIVFDSTIWHSATKNFSGEDRLAINHQFTRSYFKQHLDYPRAIGEERMKELPDRTQQLLGWYTRVPASLDEYYRPKGERLYRAGQG